MADTWWDAAYRHGRVPWDPGAYDGHLPPLLERYGIRSGKALDNISILKEVAVS